MQKMCEEITDGNQGWPDHHHSHSRENAEYQRWHQLDGCLRGPFFRLLPALGSQSIRKGAQRLCDRCSEAIGLNEHGHERARALEPRPHRKRLPCRVPLNPCALLKVNEHQFFAELMLVPLKFLTDPPHRLPLP